MPSRVDFKVLLHDNDIEAMRLRIKHTFVKQFRVAIVHNALLTRFISNAQRINIILEFLSSEVCIQLPSSAGIPDRIKLSRLVPFKSTTDDYALRDSIVDPFRPFEPFPFAHLPPFAAISCCMFNDDFDDRTQRNRRYVS